MTITAGWKSFRPYVASAIGLVGLSVLLAATRLRKLAIPLLALMVLVNGATMAVMRSRVIEPLAARYTLPVDLAKLGVGPGDEVAFSKHVSTEAYYVFYHDVYWMDVTKLLDEKPPATVDVVIGRYRPGRAEINWDGRKYGYTLLRASARGQLAVWRRQ